MDSSSISREVDRTTPAVGGDSVSPDFDLDTADIVLRSKEQAAQKRDVSLSHRAIPDQPATLFKVKTETLARHSDTFRDMLELGRIGQAASTASEIPIVDLEESRDVLQLFLTFLCKDYASFPRLAKVDEHDLVDLWHCTIKYQTPMLQMAVEQQLEQRLFDFECTLEMFLVYTTAYRIQHDILQAAAVKAMNNGDHFALQQSDAWKAAGKDVIDGWVRQKEASKMLNGL